MPLHHLPVGRASEGHQPLYCDIVCRGIILMDNGHPLRKILQPQVLDILPVEEDIPFPGIEVFGHQVEQGGFPAPVGSHDGGDFSLFYGKRRSL